MNIRTREEIGTRERHGVSLSLSDSIRYQEKFKMDEIKKKMLGPFPPETKEEKN